MAKVKRKKVVQSLTFDPTLDAALKAIYGVHKRKNKNIKLNYNGYVEGILSSYVVKLFGFIPTPEQIEEFALKHETSKSNN